MGISSLVTSILSFELIFLQISATALTLVCSFTKWNIWFRILLFVSKKLPHNPFKYIAASFIGFCGVIIYSLIPEQEPSFSDFASERIVQAIESPEAMEVLNNSVSEFNVILQDYKSNQEGTLASYRLPSSGEIFKVSLYPIQEVNKMGISEAAKITYIQAKKGIYVVSVSGNISADKKNQILQKVNFFADKLN